MKVLALLTVWGAFCSVSCKLFHSSSAKMLKPGSDLETSEFGFSMAYQASEPARLVVGAPRHDVFGKVYTCPLSDVSKDIDCSIVDMTSLNKVQSDALNAKKETNPTNFLFGSSIAATSGYFLACSPFLTKTIKYKEKHGKRFQRKLSNCNDIYGSCFLYNSTTEKYSEWVDTSVKFKDKFAGNDIDHSRTLLNSSAFIKAGGLGWNTLVDTDNGYLLVAKTAHPVDILYVDTNNPLADSKSLYEDFMEHGVIFNSFLNLGYGMAVGKFFDPSVTLYAISASMTNLQGRVLFLKANGTSRRLDMYSDPNRVASLYYIENEDMGFMFGYAMAAADINQDSLSELLVGAPAYSDEENLEFGAVHIYVGGDVLSRNNKNRMRTIYGCKENARFGSTIATSDIDGDKIPEIFVSAPHDGSGAGAVFMIIGYKLNEVLVKGDKYKDIRLSELPLTQELRGDGGWKHYGFSLQIVKDVDHNGCNELAVGSPANNSVQLIRCLPAVRTSITLDPVDYTEIVKESASQFTVKVCLIVSLRPECQFVTGSISVSSHVTGNTKILKPSFVYELTDKKEQEHCENITVDLEVPNESDIYTFTAKLNIVNDTDREGKDYKPWAVLSAQSETEDYLIVTRNCDKIDCRPILSFDMIWTGSEVIDTSTSPLNETFNIVVNNTGHSTQTATVWLKVKGSQISALTKECSSYKTNGDINEYQCSFPKLKMSQTLSVSLNTTEMFNVPNVVITAELKDKGYPKLHYGPKVLDIPCQLDTALVILKGTNRFLNVTDEDMANSEIKFFKDVYEFDIMNNGYVTWYITAVLEMKDEPYIQKFKIPSATVNCKRQNSSTGNQEFHCPMTLSPGKVVKLVSSIEILKEKIESKIAKEELKTYAKLSIRLLPTGETLYSTASIKLQYQKILSVGNNKNLVIIIVVVVALVTLLLLVIILYKYGFFKRAKKQKLDVLRESVRRRSVRIASESSRSHKASTADGTQCDIEVIDDCVFSEVDITPSTHVTKDNTELINDKAQKKSS